MRRLVIPLMPAPVLVAACGDGADSKAASSTTNQHNRERINDDSGRAGQHRGRVSAGPDGALCPPRPK